MNRREGQLEEALMEYIELYGFRDKARLAFENPDKENKKNSELLLIERAQ